MMRTAIQEIDYVYLHSNKDNINNKFVMNSPTITRKKLM